MFFIWTLAGHLTPKQFKVSLYRVSKHYTVETAEHRRLLVLRCVALRCVALRCVALCLNFLTKTLRVLSVTVKLGTENRSRISNHSF